MQLTSNAHNRAKFCKSVIFYSSLSRIFLNVADSASLQLKNGPKAVTTESKSFSSRDSWLSVKQPEDMKEGIIELLKYTDADVEKIKEPLVEQAS